MIEKITDQNLERYDSRLKEWCDRKFFEKGNYGKYQTTEEAGAVAFYPAPDTPLEGKVKFSFKETMPAEGEKGLDNPSTITGVSSIDITQTGKNLISLPYHTIPYNLYGLTWTLNSDNSVTVNGTATQDANFYFTGVETTKLRVLTGESYSLSGCPAGGSAYTYCLSAVNGAYETYTRVYDIGNGALFIPKTSSVCVVHALIRQGVTVNNITFKPQFELNTTKTEYELTNRQRTIIQLGSTYYGGEIDLATGLMTVTFVSYVFSGNTDFSTSAGLLESDGFYRLAIYPSPARSTKDIHSQCVCNILPIVSSNPDNGNYIRFGNNSSKIEVALQKSLLGLGNGEDFNTVKNAFNSFFLSHPATVVYAVSQPQTVSLTPTQILSLTQADKYTPRLNTVYTDADSVQISYLKSSIRDEYEKTQAILSLGGNS